MLTKDIQVTESCKRHCKHLNTRHTLHNMCNEKGKKDHYEFISTTKRIVITTLLFFDKMENHKAYNFIYFNGIYFN